jgi:hypothetical protein
MPDLTTEVWGYCEHLDRWMRDPEPESTQPRCNWTTDGAAWSLGDRCPACGGELVPVRVAT